MKKKDERADPTSCWNKAKDDELLFILLGRDKAAPAIIREWCDLRIELGKNKNDDLQIQEALTMAERMEKELAVHA